MTAPSGQGRLAGRLIGLGVTGSIAAFKAPELVRALQAEGADVVALLSPAATRFVAPLALQALTRHPVDDDLLALLPDARIGHIVVADTADAILVAPATAHWLGAMANGLAADTVTATCLATTAPVVVAPAMDGDMYAHPATQANVRRLRDDFGYAIVDPEEGPLASGAVGVGRLAEAGTIVDAVVAAIADAPIRAPDERLRPPQIAPAREADLSGRHILVTAGGTAEPIDPVRFIGNRSTGIMGAAIVDAAIDRGAKVTVVIGHVQAGFNPGAKAVWAETTSQMRDAVIDALPAADALIMAAAVADFRPRQAADRKLTRDGSLTLELEPTEDILAEASARAAGLTPRPILVGFAAETGSLVRAPDKLRRKGVDFLVANDVAEPGSGFGTATNRVTILDAAGGRDELPLLRKREVADRLLDRVARALDDRDTAAQTSAMSESSAR